jgi:25S rRNA (adenine2142-N1)-methyltransferase
MLAHTLKFLREPAATTKPALNPYLPSLFLVLPEPCLSNSRYLDHERLKTIMGSLGYEEAQIKSTRRLVYFLWRRVREAPKILPNFTKKEIRSGPSRNNFAITMCVL